MDFGRGREEDNSGVINAGKSVADHNFSSSSSSSPISQAIHQMPNRLPPEEENLIPAIDITEKEHMFDKVVTPSDVGKLNRLVIPKQHAEKYFPVDPSSSPASSSGDGAGEKGLILEFEDVQTGKLWKFRYSYWNSSQSYVMTKGWSRFVKEKKLDAGDVVSFHRGAADLNRKRLFIDWKRRVATTHVPAFHHFPFTTAADTATPYWVFPPLNTPGFNNLRNNNSDDLVAGPAPAVYDSAPAVHGKEASKRLRLFGVNMDCPAQDSSDETPVSQTHDFFTKGQSSSSLDLDM